MTNRVPPLLTEVVVGGFWLGAAVKVAGYTWESVSSTWTALPPPGGSGGPPSKTSAGATVKELVSNKPSDNQQAVTNILNKIGLGGIPKLNHEIAVWMKNNLNVGGSNNAPKNRPPIH